MGIRARGTRERRGRWPGQDRRRAAHVSPPAGPGRRSSTVRLRPSGGRRTAALRGRDARARRARTPRLAPRRRRAGTRRGGGSRSRAGGRAGRRALRLRRGRHSPRARGRSDERREGARLRRLHAAADAALRAGRAVEADQPARRAARIELRTAVPSRGAAAAGEDRLPGGAAGTRPACSCSRRRSCSSTSTRSSLSRSRPRPAQRLQILGDAPRLLGTARHAQSLAVELGDDGVSRLALFTLGWALCYAGHPEEGVPLVKETAGAVEHGSDGLDPLEILRGSLALDWLDRSAGRSPSPDEPSTRRVPAARWGWCHTWCSAGMACSPGGIAGGGLRQRVRSTGPRPRARLQLPRMQALLTLTAVTARRGAEEECRAYADEAGSTRRGRGHPRVQNLGTCTRSAPSPWGSVVSMRPRATSRRALRGSTSSGCIRRASCRGPSWSRCTSGRASGAGGAALYRYSASPRRRARSGRRRLLGGEAYWRRTRISRRTSTKCSPPTSYRTTLVAGADAPLCRRAPPPLRPPGGRGA